MVSLVLTEADMRDLGEGATINAMDENGDEIILDGRELGLSTLDDLTNGEAVVWGDHLITYPEEVSS